MGSGSGHICSDAGTELKDGSAGISVEGLRLQGLAIHASDGAIGDLGKKSF